MTRVKICGIQKAADAICAAEAGADLIGVVFVPGRRRCLEIGAAQAIVKALQASGGHVPQVVGLFADQPLEEVNDIIRACELDLAQLCGGESLDYCDKVQADVIKVVYVPAPAGPPPTAQPGPARPDPVEGRGVRGSTGSPRAVGSREDIIAGLAEGVRAYRDAGHLVALDRLVEGLQGGTGRSFDWGIAARLSQKGLSFLLAGGLTPENVARAVATVRPWGVDVSSGVETGGAKDHDKIRAFVRNARKPSAVSRQARVRS